MNERRFLEYQIMLITFIHFIIFICGSIAKFNELYFVLIISTVACFVTSTIILLKIQKYWRYIKK